MVIFVEFWLVWFCGLGVCKRGGLLLRMRNVEGSGGSGCDVVSFVDGDCCGVGGDDGSGSVWFLE